MALTNFGPWQSWTGSWAAGQIADHNQMHALSYMDGGRNHPAPQDGQMCGPRGKTRLVEGQLHSFPVISQLLGKAREVWQILI